jgi:hypothetical protein
VPYSGTKTVQRDGREAGTRHAPPKPPPEAAGAQGPAGVAAVRLVPGLLARPARLTLGGLTAALESVVEEGKLGLARPGMYGRRLILEAAIGGEVELCVGVRPEEVDQALEG